jgi:hypothetical protein
MFDVVVDPEVIEQLASRLDVLSSSLTHLEWAHLVALLGLGSTALADAICTGTGSESPEAPSRREIVALGSPGFADALNPAAEAIGGWGTSDARVVIVNGPGTTRWEVTSRTGSPDDGAGIRAEPVGQATNHVSSDRN